MGTVAVYNIDNGDDDNGARCVNERERMNCIDWSNDDVDWNDDNNIEQSK